MVILGAALLTDSGRPRLLPGEVERCVYDNADLEFEGAGGLASATADKYLAGLCYVTSYRLIWVDKRSLPAAGTSCAVPLVAVAAVAPPKRPTFGITTKTPRVKVAVYVTDMITAAQGAAQAVGQVPVTVVLRGGAHDVFLEQLGIALQQKAWPDATSVPGGAHAAPARIAPGGAGGAGVGADGGQAGPRGGEGHANPLLSRQHPGAAARDHPTATTATGYRTGAVGVAGILRSQEAEAAANSASLEQAFSDMQALMDKAKDMVALAQRLRAKLGAGGAGADGAEMEAMQAMLLEMGIASPVTKESAGALYHQELSRQLADFLGGALQREGGMMTLPDVYCLFNRARGSELISPEDLLQACHLWAGLGIPLRLRRFESGVLCVEAAAHSDDEVCATLGMLLEGNDRASLGARDAAEVLGVPLALAAEHLLTAEKRGVLCRDDGPDGLRFFRNFFRDEGGAGEGAGAGCT